ncbi:restriction endonuclease subunit S [Marinifilum flexuosum]|uniref:restriction endonuclease subunit S n=1 Tax=Marinifilum flexuosum TaxID=1117708 RepID=UPI002490FD9C|nr:restriction endonuclease subunit S [Marinifilum flexuosum]
MKKVMLGEVCQFINGDRGKNYPSQSSFTAEGIPFINAGDIANRAISTNKLNYISSETYKKLNSGKVEKGDILFCLRGSIGKVGINKYFKKGAIASSLMIIRTGEHIDSKFLLHYLSSPLCKMQIAKFDNGSSQPNLSATSVQKFKVPLPLLNDQKRIAAILDEADYLNQKDRQLLDKYNELSHSIFFDMFGDPVVNPKSWETFKLKDLSVKILNGATPKGGSDVYVKKGITFFRSQNVWKNKLIYDDIAYLDEDTHYRMHNSSLKYGDLLITKTGRINTENSSLGRAAIFLGKDDSANINGHVYLIRLKKEINNKFVLFILTTNSYRDYIRRVCVGGIDKRQINKDHLEEFPIIFPPKEQQKKFAVIIDEIEKQKSQIEKSIEKSEELFQSLLQRAFKGEL